MRSMKFAVCLAKAARKVAACRDELCQLDTFIGDGDHGITVERGFLAAADAAETLDGPIDHLFLNIGSSMSRAMGGAIGPLYGVFWSAVAAGSRDATGIQASLFAQAIAAGVENVMRVGKANEGDKTMVDAMAPCARAMLEAAETEPLTIVIERGAKAAAQGSLATQNMIARKGRARFLGDKSLGYIDPGAASFAIFMEALAQTIKTEEDIQNS